MTVQIRTSGWRNLVCCIGALLAIEASPARAFGSEGHQTIGAIAEQQLVGSRAEREVKGILLSGETLSSVSIWADCAKGYCGALTDEMKTFVHANPRHHDYHFADVPYQLERYQFPGVGTGENDVVHILQQCISVLRGKTGAADNPHDLTRRQALLLLVHLVGDVHQPLHVGTGYIDDNDDFVIPLTQADVDDGKVLSTHGDNYLQLGSRPLHSYWDTDVIKSAMRRAKGTSPVDYAALLISRVPSPPSATDDAASWPERWANESLALAKRAHELVAIGERTEAQDRYGGTHVAWPVTVPLSYLRMAPRTAEKAIANAGYRLAEVLRTIWP